MAHTPAVPRVLRFGVFEADLQARELRKQGMQIKLQEQPFQILAFLLEHAGEIVTREQIRKRLWPTDTFVDVDNSVNAAINRLREALGDSAESPRFVETLPRRGYRFVAPVTEVMSSPCGLTSPSTGAGTRARLDEFLAGSSSRARRSWGKLLIALGLAVISIVALVRAWERWRAPGPPHITSVAVLPLDNLSGDPNQDYFADGMTDELITNLGKISALQVISRTSVMHHKGTRLTLPEIAHELKVDALVEGSVARSGNKVRMTAQLIQASNDRHLWADSYQRDLDDLLSVQDSVALEIARQVRIRLTSSEQQRLERHRSVNSEAYEDYLEGHFLLWRQGEGDARKGIAYFQRAIQKDPNYALAYAGIAECYITLGQPWTGALSPKEILPQAKAAASKAFGN